MIPQPVLDISQKYRTLLVKRLRAVDVKRAQSDGERIHEINSMSDGEVLRRWMWLAVLISAPTFFLAVPFILSVVGTFIPTNVADFLWNTNKVFMGTTFALFLLAIYLTLTESSR